MNIEEMYYLSKVKYKVKGVIAAFKDPEQKLMELEWLLKRVNAKVYKYKSFKYKDLDNIDQERIILEVSRMLMEKGKSFKWTHYIRKIEKLKETYIFGI